MANAEKLLKLVDVIAAAEKDGEWDQEVWAEKVNCRTTLCAAGWQCVIEGKKLEFEWDGLATRTTDGEDIPVFAQKSLELSDAEALLLFWNTETNFKEFKENVARIIAGQA